MTEDTPITEKEKRAYRDAFRHFAAAYFELSQVVGAVNASDFLRRLIPVPEAKSRGGRRRKDTPNRRKYNTPDAGKTGKMMLHEGENTEGDERQRIQRRNREDRENAATRAAILEENERRIEWLRRYGVPEREIMQQFFGSKARSDFLAIKKRVTTLKSR